VLPAAAPHAEQKRTGVAMLVPQELQAGIISRSSLSLQNETRLLEIARKVTRRSLAKITQDFSFGRFLLMPRSLQPIRL
jgi:hypothetical protein